MARGKTNGNTTGANLGFEAKLWSIAKSLRSSMLASLQGNNPAKPWSWN